MRLSHTLILAVILVVLGGYVYFFELQKGEKGKPDRLLNFKEDEAASVVLSYPEREIQLLREPSGKWKLTQPLQAGADGSAVRSILSALSASEIKRTLEKKPGPDDIKSFGLDRPAVKVSLTLKNGLTLPSLIVGAKTPLGDSAYVQRGSDPGVYLTGAMLPLVLEKEPNDLRDKTVLDFPPAQVARLGIQTPEESLILTKSEKEQWTIEAPVKKNAKAAAVTGYLAALAELRAQTFVDDQPKELKKYGLDPAALKISIDGKDGKNLAALQIGGKSGESYYAKREGNPTVYAIDGSSYKLLRKQPADFLAEEKKEPKK